MTSVRANAFQGASLDDVRLVILANVETLPEAAVGKLERFVDRGGSLLVFLGDQAVPAFYNNQLADPSRSRGSLLPARLAGSGPKGNPSAGDDQPPVAGVGDFAEDHPALSGFGSGETGRLGAVGFSAYWALDPTPNSRVVMATGGGEPLLCEHLYGQGRVALFASSCDRDWSNFPVRRPFCRSFTGWLGILRNRPEARVPRLRLRIPERTRPPQFCSGELLPHRTGDSTGGAGGQSIAGLRVVKPDRTIGVFESMADPTLRQVAFSETDQPGVYRFDERVPTAAAFVRREPGGG
ncbi:MAG: hypothetical protein Ct9H300mP1_16620 [Planctomycetaceae bacterium]|nr:MAG: hypothetical protein Ct9H300mP1_16620 [Planctomycetaceae bacterium]